MKCLLSALALCLWPSLGWAQNITCPTRLFADSTNACASTAFVTSGIAANFASPPAIGNVAPAPSISTLVLTVPSLPGLSTSVTFPSSFAGPPSFGLALPSGANPWVITATTSSPATANAGGVLFVTNTQSQPLVSVAISNASPAVVTLSNHGLVAGNAVSFLGTLGTPLVASATYYVCAAGLTTNTFEISSTSTCVSPINTTGASSGVTMATNHGLPGTDPAITGYNVVSQGSVGNYSGVLGTIANSNTMASQPLGVASAVAIYGTGVCVATGCSATWGGVLAGYDTSGQSNPPNSLIGAEIDNYAVGTDAGNIRVVEQLVCSTPFGVGINSCGTGVLISASGVTGGGQLANAITGATSKMINAITFGTAIVSGVLLNGPGFQIDGLGNVLLHSLTGVVLVNSDVSPTINTGFCTAPSIINANGTFTFQIKIGNSGCAGSTGVVNMPTATTGWECQADDLSAPATDVVSESSYSPSTVTFTNFVRTTGVAGNWNPADVINVMCSAF